MAFARTIDGDIDPAKLGAVDAHEHLIRTGGGEILVDGEDMRLIDVDKAITEARSYQVSAREFLDVDGTIVDMCPIDCGRDVEKLRAISAAVPGLNIIVTTGFQKSHMYQEESTHWISRYSVDQIAELVIADIEVGVDVNDYSGPFVERSAAKAGVIKIATSYGVMTDLERKLIEACAAASVETGCPINTHTQHGTLALDQVKLLTSYGVKPEKIAVGHVQRNPDPYELGKVTETGAYLMLDGTYRLKYLPDSSRVQLLRSLTDAGYGSQLLLGTDSGKKSYQKVYGAATGVDYDMTVFGPRLLHEGFSETEVRGYYVDNAREFFTFAA